MHTFDPRRSAGLQHRSLRLAATAPLSHQPEKRRGGHLGPLREGMRCFAVTEDVRCDCADGVVIVGVVTVGVVIV